MKTKLILGCLLLIFPLASFAECYLSIDGKHKIDKTAAEQIALVELSQYVEPISDQPVAGISDKQCIYQLVITELGSETMVVIKGPKISAFAESNLEGIKGFHQALLKSIVKKYPGKKPAVCKDHPSIMASECSESARVNSNVNSSETVYDSNTDLTWVKQEPEKMNWKNASSYCKNLTLAGIMNWRLPNRNELKSIYPIRKQFPNLEDIYWSSTPVKGEKYYSWAYSTKNNEPFDDWIENKYFVKCVYGSNESLADDSVEIVTENAIASEPVEEYQQEETSESDNSLGFRWAFGPVYISGYTELVQLYVDNIEEQGYTVDNEDAGYPIGITFRPYYQTPSGFRYGLSIGPIMSIFIETNYEDYSFLAIPVDVNAGYTFASGMYLRGGISYPVASGDFVSSQSLGIVAAAGMEILRKNIVSFGFEIGIDSSSVKLDKYDCDGSPTPYDLTTCESDTVTIYPVGLMGSFLVVF